MGASDLVNAKSIRTTGLMKGPWSRVTSQIASNFVFISETHPNFRLTFAKAYLVTVEWDGSNKYDYFWNPETKDLGVKWEENNLTIDVVDGDTAECKQKSNRNQKDYLSALVKENRVLRSKIDDLSKQVQSLQYICMNQEKNLVNLTYDEDGKRRDSESVRNKTTDIANKPNVQNLNVPTSNRSQMQQCSPLRSYDTQRPPTFEPFVNGPSPTLNRRYDPFYADPHCLPFHAPYEHISYSYPPYDNFMGPHLQGSYYSGYARRPHWTSPLVPDPQAPFHVSSPHQPLPKAEYANRPTEAIRYPEHFNSAPYQSNYSHLPMRDNQAVQSVTVPQPVQTEISCAPVNPRQQEAHPPGKSQSREQNYGRDRPTDYPYAYAQRPPLPKQYANVELLNPTANLNEHWKQNGAEEEKGDWSMDAYQASGNNPNEDVVQLNGLDGPLSESRREAKNFG